MKVHIAWFIGWTCLGVVIGAALCLWVPVCYFTGYVFIVPLIVLIFCMILRWRWMLLIVFCSGVVLGLCRGSPVVISMQTYEPYVGQTVQLSGKVSQDAAIGDSGDQKITLKHVIINETPMSGTVWVSVKKFDIKRGDTLHLSGKLTSGFGNMSATMYRAAIINVERPNPGDIARRVRDWFGEGARKAIPEPQVNLGLGYLVGQKTALPKTLEEEIKIVGLTHAVVASGYNLTILVVFSRTLFLKLSKYMATVCSTLMVFAFMCVTGFSPSMSRAGLVACLGLLVWYYGRKTHPFVLLSFAAAVTVLVNPSYVWGDLGWYLSFGSFIGVIVLAPLIHRYFWGKTQPSMVRSLTVETLSAQIVTQPLIQYAFGLYSVYALPANMMVLPLVPLAMLYTFLAGLAGLILPESLAVIAGMPAYWILKYSTSVISWWANLPSAQIELKFNVELMLIGYIVICTLILFLKRRTKYDFRAKD